MQVYQRRTTTCQRAFDIQAFLSVLLLVNSLLPCHQSFSTVEVKFRTLLSKCQLQFTWGSGHSALWNLSHFNTSVHAFSLFVLWICTKRSMTSFTWANQTLMMWSMSLAEMSSGPHCQPIKGEYCHFWSILKTFSLHGIPEHLLAGVDPGFTSVWIWYGRLYPECQVYVERSKNRVLLVSKPPFRGQGEGLVWGGLLVWGRHHIRRVHLGVWA